MVIQFSLEKTPATMESVHEYLSLQAGSRDPAPGV
jgi:hypothetical protein